MSGWDDSHLWSAYHNAETEQEKNKAAGDIVWFHRKYIFRQSNRLAHRTWDAEMRADLDQELLLLAMQLVPKFDRSKGTFLSFLSSWMRPSVAWSLVRKSEGSGVTEEGYMAILEMRNIEDTHQRGLSNEEMCIELRNRMRIKIEPQRVGQLRSFALKSIDDSVVDHTVEPSFEDQWVNQLELEGNLTALRAALAKLGDLSPLEQDLLDRFYNPEVSLMNLAVKYGISRQAVGHHNTKFVSKIRSLFFEELKDSAIAK